MYGMSEVEAIWEKALKEKVKRFNVETSEIESVEAGKAFQSAGGMCDHYAKLINTYVDYIELPKAFKTAEDVVTAFRTARGLSPALHIIHDPSFPVPEGMTVFGYGTTNNVICWAFDGKALYRCVNSAGEYVASLGEGYKERQERLAREEAERLAREAEEKRLAEEKAEAERRQRNLERLSGIDQGVFDRFMQSVESK